MRNNHHVVEGPGGRVCTAQLPPSSATLNWRADLLRGHLQRIGSRWRALSTGKIAAIVLAVLRCDQRLADMAGGNGVHRTTVGRWVKEAVRLHLAQHQAGGKVMGFGSGLRVLDALCGRLDT